MRRKLLAGGLFGLSAVLLLVGAAFTLMPAGEGRRDPAFGQLSLAVAPAWLFYAAIGAIVAARRPDKAIGWILCGIGLASQVSTAADAYAGSAAYPILGSPFDEWLVPLFSGFWNTQFSLVLVLLLVVPHGRLLSPRWRPILWLALLPAAGGPLLSSPNVGPAAVHAAVLDRAFSLDAGSVQDTLGPLVALDFLVLFPLAIASIVLRFRRSRGPERQQLKWIAYACVLLGVGVPVIELVGHASGAFEPTAHLSVTFALAALVFTAGLVALPLATALAIFRYRLYDIDLLINRTLVYGATSAAIAASFFGGIFAIQAVLRPLTAGSELAVAVSTLVSFALFQPVRRRVQDAVDRRFDRSGYDAARTLELFADRLRDEVDLDALRGDLLGAVSQTMSPAHASLWLRERAR